MKKNIVIIILLSMVLALALALTLSISQADKSEPIEIKVTREGKDIAVIHDGELYTAYKSCNFSGDRFELVFSPQIASYDYRLMAKHWDGSQYQEQNFEISRTARTVGDAINYLTVVGYDENDEFVAQATFIIDTSWLSRERE